MFLSKFEKIYRFSKKTIKKPIKIIEFEKNLYNFDQSTSKTLYF